MPGSTTKPGPLDATPKSPPTRVVAPPSPQRREQEREQSLARLAVLRDKSSARTPAEAVEMLNLLADLCAGEAHP